MNLFSNAVKFTDKNGKILILVEKLATQVRVSVVDTGIGIKKKDQSRLFEMFGSIKDEKKKVNVQGVGLGLVICKLIVNKFDGEIDFISEHKKGSTFFFTFEIDQPDRQQIDHSETDSESDKTSERQCKTTLSFRECIEYVNKHKQDRIMCVDDEEFCLASMKTLLSKSGVDV